MVLLVWLTACTTDVDLVVYMDNQTRQEIWAAVDLMTDSGALILQEETVPARTQVPLVIGLREDELTTIQAVHMYAERSSASDFPHYRFDCIFRGGEEFTASLPPLECHGSNPFYETESPTEARFTKDGGL